jgi:hypothetical protein
MYIRDSTARPTVIEILLLRESLLAVIVTVPSETPATPPSVFTVAM